MNRAEDDVSCVMAVGYEAMARPPSVRHYLISDVIIPRPICDT